MFEIIIFCVIVLAVGYWATLFVMGRRDDVLHGDFVEFEGEAEPVPSFADGAAPMAWPKRPEPMPKLQPLKKLPNSEALQSLLVSLKQELNNASQSPS
jgi:hypothetical protein